MSKIQQQDDEDDELPEDSNEKVEQQYVSDEQVDTKQYRCRPLDAVDICAVVSHLLTYVVSMSNA